MKRTVSPLFPIMFVLAGCAGSHVPRTSEPPAPLVSEELDLSFEVPDVRWRAYERPALRGTHVRPPLVLVHDETRAVLSFTVSAEEASVAETRLRRQAERHPAARKVVDMANPAGRNGFFVLYRDGGFGLVMVAEHPYDEKGRVILQGYSRLPVDETLLELVHAYFVTVRGA